MIQNLLIGLSVIVFCMIIQCAMIAAVVRPIMKGSKSNEDAGFFELALHLSMVLLTLLVGNLIQVAIWGTSFVILGEFDDIHAAVYHSMVNFTALGYGDLVMSEKRRLLGGLEALNGMIMLGLSTSVMYGIFRFYFQAEWEKLSGRNQD
jgi:hypothetical protein